MSRRYSVSKGAQFGLMNALAGEGMDTGILVNAVSPIAATRIFRRQTAPGELTPESVAPGVAMLASRDCPVTGTVLTAAGGAMGRRGLAVGVWKPTWAATPPRMTCSAVVARRDLSRR